MVSYNLHNICVVDQNKDCTMNKRGTLSMANIDYYLHFTHVNDFIENFEYSVFRFHRHFDSNKNYFCSLLTISIRIENRDKKNR